MVHSFDIDVAEKYGITEAIIIHNIAFWSKKTVTDYTAWKYKLHEGLAWVYNSVSAWQVLFPYMSMKKIRTALKSLETKGALRSANFNKMKADRTKWYAICNKEIADKYKIYDGIDYGTWPFAAEGNWFAPEGRPLPVINTVINKDKDIISQISEKSETESRTGDKRRYLSQLACSALEYATQEQIDQLSEKCYPNQTLENYIEFIIGGWSDSIVMNFNSQSNEHMIRFILTGMSNFR